MPRFQKGSILYGFVKYLQSFSKMFPKNYTYFWIHHLPQKAKDRAASPSVCFAGPNSEYIITLRSICPQYLDLLIAATGRECRIIFGRRRTTGQAGAAVFVVHATALVDFHIICQNAAIK